MTHSLTNRLPLSALLRNASGIAAPVINSLCCAAAGITKALSATAGVLIPHKKLREAAHVDAPLNAKNRPPAQPAVGYKHPLQADQPHSNPTFADITAMEASNGN